MTLTSNPLACISSTASLEIIIITCQNGGVDILYDGDDDDNICDDGDEINDYGYINDYDADGVFIEIPILKDQSKRRLPGHMHALH